MQPQQPPQPMVPTLPPPECYDQAMPLEIEIKMRLSDVAALEKKLRSVGARRIVQLHEINTFLDTPRGKLRKSDQGLRVRIETHRATGKHRNVIITHKGPRKAGKAKSRPETEIHTHDASHAIALFEALGYKTTLAFEKHRDRWKLGDCHIELDHVPLLGRFVEIEGPSEAQIMKVRQKLGLGKTPLVKLGYASMLSRQIKKQRIDSREIRFPVSK